MGGTATAHEFQHRRNCHPLEAVPESADSPGSNSSGHLLVNRAHAIAPAARSKRYLRDLCTETAPTVIEIRDTGEGMRADVIKRIFEPSSPPRNPGSTGSVVHRHGIVKSLGGDIQLRHTGQRHDFHHLAATGTGEIGGPAARPRQRRPRVPAAFT
jgi:hypothetical protein